MAAAPQHRLPELDHSTGSATGGAGPPTPIHGNDNAETSGAIAALTESKRRIWERFIRWLMLGGLSFILILVVLLAFIYWGSPYGGAHS